MGIQMIIGLIFLVLLIMIGLKNVSTIGNELIRGLLSNILLFLIGGSILGLFFGYVSVALFRTANMYSFSGIVSVFTMGVLAWCGFSKVCGLFGKKN
jgi:hypothetical protein